MFVGTFVWKVLITIFLLSILFAILFQSEIFAAIILISGILALITGLWM